MTKPAAPPRANTSNVVEIDAMDVMEWQHGQRTPQANDANLAALVKQSARSGESAPVMAEGPRTPSLVARARVTEAPPVRPRASQPPAPRPAGSTVIPTIAPARTGHPASVSGSATPAIAVAPASPATSSSMPAMASATAPAMAASASSVAPHGGSAFPAIGTPPPPADLPKAAIPMSVGGYPVYPAPAMAPSIDPAGYHASQASGGSYTDPFRAPPQRPGPGEHPSHRMSSPELVLSGEPREARAPRIPRRLLWIGGATGCAAAILAVIVMAGSASRPTAPTAAPESRAATSAAAATAPTAAPAEPVTTATTASPSAPATETKPRFPEAVAHAPVRAPATVAAAVPPPAPLAHMPARPARPAHRLGGKKVVVEYQSHASEAPVPSLVAQASEDPAIARARSAYLTGNDKLFAGDAPAAIEAYREALGLYPGYVGGYRGLGLAYAQLGNTKQALDALKTYVTAAPSAKDVGLIKKRIARLQSK